jgi:peptidoglycan/xylan/chitin deacetylase (PgdA/CDA1 family)
MRNWVLRFISACFYYSGLVHLIRWWLLRSGQRLTILNYHRAAGGDLRRHLLYLRRHYRLLHLERALEELYMPDKEEVQRADRRPPLVLTFDDGYRDNYTHAFALARALQVPITIFLIPGYMESGNSFWWFEVDHLVRRAQADEMTIEGRSYHLNQPREQKALAEAIDARVRYATSIAEREAFLTSVRKALDVTLSMTEEEKLALPLSWAEVLEMEQSGWVSFGAHTVHHQVLGCLADPAEVQREVEECRTILEQQLGHPVRTFAYPYGGPEDIGEHGLRAVQQAGYDWAATTIPGFNTRRSNPYLLRRVFASVNQHWVIIAAKTSGGWGFFACLFDIVTLLFRRNHTNAIERGNRLRKSLTSDLMYR